MLPRMAHFPHPHTNMRAPRVCVTTGEFISFSQEGKQVRGALQVISLTGGSARFLRPLNPGTFAEISLNTKSSSISALVEFLHPRRQGQFFTQAFRFLAFGDDDYVRFNQTLQLMRAGPAQAAPRPS